MRDSTSKDWKLHYITILISAQKTCIENLGESRTLKLSGCQGRAGNPSAENSCWKKK
jgi:hypothetical protein